MRPHCQVPLRATAALLAAVAVLSFPGAALAGDDDVPIDTQVVRSIMEGLGLRSGREAGINYQERAPLVIPPNSDLPPPQSSGAAIARNPAWPKDPDISRAKAQAAMEKDRNLQEEFDREQNRLSPDQMTPGPKPRKTVRTQGSVNSGDYNSRMSPSELGYHGGLFGFLGAGKGDEDKARFTGEPARTSLTEPPTGYQTPSPDQPYGLGKSAAPRKATDYYTTKGEVNSNTQ